MAATGADVVPKVESPKLLEDSVADENGTLSVKTVESDDLKKIQEESTLRGKECEDLRKQVEEKDKTIREAEAKLKTLGAMAEKKYGSMLSERIKECEDRCKKEYQALEMERIQETEDRYQQEYQVLERQLNESKHNHNKEYETQHATVMEKNRIIHEKETEIKNLKANAVLARNEHSAAVERIHKGYRDTNRKSSKDIGRPEQDLQARNKEHEIQRAIITEKNRIIHENETEIRNLKANALAARNEHSAAVERIHKGYVEGNRKSSKDIERLEQDLQDRNKECEDLRKDAKDINRNELREAQNHGRNRDSELAKAQQRIGKLEKEVLELKKDIRVNLGKIKELKSTVARQDEDIKLKIDQYNSDKARARGEGKKIKELEAQHESDLAEIERLKDAYPSDDTTKERNLHIDELEAGKSMWEQLSTNLPQDLTDVQTKLVQNDFDISGAIADNRSPNRSSFNRGSELQTKLSQVEEKKHDVMKQPKRRASAEDLSSIAFESISQWRRQRKQRTQSLGPYVDDLQQKIGKWEEEGRSFGFLQIKKLRSRLEQSSQKESISHLTKPKTQLRALSQELEEAMAKGSEDEDEFGAEDMASIMDTKPEMIDVATMTEPTFNADVQTDDTAAVTGLSTIGLDDTATKTPSKPDMIDIGVTADLASVKPTDMLITVDSKLETVDVSTMTDPETTTKYSPEAIDETIAFIDVQQKAIKESAGREPTISLPQINTQPAWLTFFIKYQEVGISIVVLLLAFLFIAGIRAWFEGSSALQEREMWALANRRAHRLGGKIMRRQAIEIMRKAEDPMSVGWITPKLGGLWKNV